MNIFDIFIVQPIFNLLVAIYSFIPGGDFGVSLIIFTIIIRMLMWPLIKKQLHQVKAMRKIQPELKKMRAKYKDNKQAQGMAMLELYKKHGINPFRTLGIVLVQLPVFIGIYRVVQIFSNERDRIADYTYSFLENLAPIKAVIDSPAAFQETLLGLVDLTDKAIGSDGLNVALILIAVAAAYMQYLLAKQTMPQSDSDRRLRDVLSEAAEGKDPDQSEINAIVSRKMMKMLPLFLFVIMLTLPGAIALYYLVSNIVGYLQQSFILRQDETELEELAAEEPQSTKKPTAKTAKARAKTAKKATITKDNQPRVTRIKANDNRKGK